MHNLQYYDAQDVDLLEAQIDLEDLLKVIDYCVEKIQRGPGKWKCFCPIHKESVFRSLTVDVVKRTFRCGFIHCPGHRGGSLLDLYQLALEKSEVETVEFWSKRLKFTIRQKEATAAVKEPPAEAVAPAEDLEEYEEALDIAAGGEFTTEDGQQASEADLVQEYELAEPEETGLETAKPELLEEAPVERAPDEAIQEAALESLPVEVAPPAPPPKSPDQYVLDVSQSLSEDRLDEAESLLTEALERHPEHPALLECRVRWLRQSGESGPAAEVLRSLIEWYRKQHLPEGCLRTAHQLLELCPEDLEIYETISAACLERHETTQAIRSLYDAAAQAVQCEQPDRALGFLDRILDISSDETRPLEEKIQILTGLGRTVEAVAAQVDLARVYVHKELVGKACAVLDKAIEVDPQCREAFHVLIDLYQARGMQQQAVQVLQRMAEAMLAAGDTEEAIEVYLRILSLEPKQTEARNRLALLYKHAERPQDALEQYFQIAAVYREKEMLGRALRVYENVLKQWPESIQAHEMIAEVLLEKGDEAGAAGYLSRLADVWAAKDNPDEAERGLRRAIELAPQSESLRRRLIDFYSKTSQKDKAVQEYQLLLDMLEQERREEDMRRCCEEMLQLDPENPRAKTALASLERAEQAVEDYVGQPGSVQSRVAQARVHVAEGRYEEGIEALKAALLIETGNEQLWLDLAEAYLASGRQDEAAETYLRLSRERRQQGQMEPALKVLQKAQERIPGRLDLLRAQAQLELDWGASEKALVSFQSLVERCADNAEDWFTLARLADERRREDQALEAFRRAATLFADSDRLQPARQCLRRALELAPEDTPLRLWLAELMERAGDTANATIQQLKAAAILQASGQGEESLEVLEQVLAAQPRNLQALEQWFAQVEREPDQLRARLDRALSLVGLYQEQGLLGKAGRHLETLRERLENEPAVFRAQVEFFRETGSVQKAVSLLLEWGRRQQDAQKAEEALACYQEAEQLQPERPEVLLAQLKIYQSLSDAEQQCSLLLRLAERASDRGLIGKQIGFLAQAWDLKPDRSDIGEMLAELYLAKGDETSAVETYRQLVALHQEAGQLDEVRKGYEKVVAIQPEKAAHRFALAKHLLEAGQPKTALEQFERIAQQYAGQLPPSDPEQQVLLEEVYRRRYELSDDLNHLRQLGHFYKATLDYPAAQCAYLETLERVAEDQPQLAIELCRELLDVAPGETAIERRLVDLYQQVGEEKAAARLLRALWKRYLGNWQQAGKKAVVTSGALVDRVGETAHDLLVYQPENDSVHRQMAEFHLAIGQEEEAVAHWISLGEIFTEQGDKEQAAAVYRRILEIRPALLEVRVRLAEVLESQGQRSEAVEEYLQLGRAFASEKRWEEARSNLQRAMELDSASHDAALALLEVAEKQGDSDQSKALLLHLAEIEEDAIVRLERCLELDPDDQAVRERYIEALQTEGRFELLLEQLEIILPKHQKAGQYDLALSLLDRVRERFPQRVELYESAIQVLEDQERKAKREKLPEPIVLRIAQQLNGERQACAELYEQAGDSEAVVRLLAKVARSDKDNEPCRRKLIELYQAQDDMSKAAALWQELGDLAAARGRMDEAQQAYSQALELAPRSRNARQRLADVNAKRGSMAEAVDQQRRLAQMALEENDWTKAEAALEEVLKYLPEDQESLQQLAERYCEQEDAERAGEKAEVLLLLAERRQDAEAVLRWADFILDLDPQRSAVLQKRATALLELARLEEAADSLWRLAQEYRQQQLDNAEKSVCLKVLDLGLARYELNRKAAERLFDLGLDRRARTELERLARESLEAGQAQAAVEIFQALLDRHPDETEYLVGLAESYTRAEQWAQALKQRQLLHARYQHQNRPVEMVANLRTALQLAPQQAELHRQLGDVLADLDNYREAIQSFLEGARLAQADQDRLFAADCYRRIIQIDPNHLEAHQRFHALQAGCALSDEEREELLEVRRHLLALLVERGREALPEIDRLSEILQADYPDDDRVVQVLIETYRELNPERAATLSLGLLEILIRREDWQRAEAQLEQLRLFGPLRLSQLERLLDACGGTPLDGKLAPERVLLAEAYVDRQDREAAIVQYEALVNLDPEQIEYRQGLIDNLDVSGQHTRSRAEKIHLARLYQAQGRIAESVRCIESALNYEKDNLECLRVLADYYCEMNVPGRARPVLQQIVEIADDQGDLEKAEQYSRRLTELFPGEGELLEQLARLQETRGQVEQALQSRLAAAEAYAEGDQVDRALEAYEASIPGHPEPTKIRQRLADLLRAKGLQKEALAQEQQLIQWHLQQAQPEQALACYKRMLNRDPENLGLLEQMADLLEDQGETEQAIDALYRLAELYRLRERLRRAQETLQRVLSLAPCHEAARRRLADIYIERGMDSKGQSELLELARLVQTEQITPEDPAGELEALGCRILELSGEHLEMLQDLAALLEPRRQQEPQWAGGLWGDLHLALCRAYLSRGEADQAGACLEVVREASPDSPERPLLEDQLRRLERYQIPQAQFSENLRSARQHWEHGEYGAAAQLYEQLLKAQPRNLELVEKLAEAYDRQGLSPKASDLLDRSGHGFLSERNFPAAQRCFQRLVELAPDRLSAHEALAELAVAEGNPEAAVRQYLHLADRVEEPRQLPELVSALEQARDIQPESEEVLRRLGTAYRKLKRQEEAIETYRALAEQCRRRGHLEGTVQALQEALALGPELTAARLAEAPPSVIIQGIGLHEALAQALAQGGSPALAAEHWLTAGQLALAAGGQTRDFDLAEESFRRVLDLPSRNLETPVLNRAYEGLAETYVQAGKPESAAEVFFRLARYQQSRGYSEAALEALERAQALAPERREYLEPLCQAYQQAGREEDYVRWSLKLAEALLKRDLIGRAEAVYRTLRGLPRWAEEGQSPERGEPSYASVVAPLLQLCLDKGATAEAVELLADLAERYERAGEIDRALKQLNRVLELQPDHVESLERLARAHFDQEQESQALETLTRLATLHEQRGYPQTALEILFQILEHNPEHPQALESIERLSQVPNLAASAHQSLNERFEQAFQQEQVQGVRCLGRVLLRLDPRAEEVRMRLAEAFLWEGDAKSAVEHLLRLADQYEKGREWARVNQSLTRAAEIASDDAAIQARLEKVRQLLAEQAESEQRASLRRSIDQSLSGAHPEQALGDMTTLLNQSPEDVSVVQWAARLFQQAGQGHEPFVAPAEPSKRKGWLARSVELYLQLVGMYRSKGQLEEARLQVEQVLQIDPDHAEAAVFLLETLDESGQEERLLERGRLLAEQQRSRGQLSSAADTLRWLLKRLPDETALMGELAATLQRMNLPAEAREVYRRQAEEFFQRELYAQSLSAYNEILSLFPDDRETFHQIAQAYVARGDVRGALTYYQKALDQDLARNDYPAAEALLEQMIELDPGQPGLRREKIDLLRREGKQRQALEELQRLAAAYLDQERLNRAMEVWQEILDLQPDHRAVRMQLIEGYQQKGQPAEAARQYLEMAEVWQARDEAFAGQCLNQAIQLQPDQPEFLRPYVDYLAQQGQKKECLEQLLTLAQVFETRGAVVEALQTYQQMHRLDSEDPLTLESLVRLHEALEQFEQSAPYLEQLAQLYEEQGQKEKAVDSYLRAANYYYEVGVK